MNTKYFLQQSDSITQWIAVEDNKEWYDYLNKEITDSRFQLILRPPSSDKTKDEWYQMENESPLRVGKYFREYIDIVSEIPTPDFILIDGRSRLQCLEKAHSCISDGGVVVMDDAHRISRNKKDWRPLMRKWKVDRITKKMFVFKKK